MSAAGGPERSMSRPGRRTVRIITRRGPSRAATISLVVAVAAAALLFFVWRIWQKEDDVSVYVRTIRDVELDWRCEGGHLFRSLGQVEPRPCWMCGETAYPVTQYHCSVHGSFEVDVRFAENADGVATPEQLRLPGGGWVRADPGLKCPRCGKKLVRRQAEDPIAAIKRGKKRKEGR